MVKIQGTIHKGVQYAALPAPDRVEEIFDDEDETEDVFRHRKYESPF